MTFLIFKSRCHELTDLNLRLCENVTDAGIEALGSKSSLMSIDTSVTSISDTVSIRLKNEKSDYYLSRLAEKSAIKIHLARNLHGNKAVELQYPESTF